MRHDHKPLSIADGEGCPKGGVRPSAEPGQGFTRRQCLASLLAGPLVPAALKPPAKPNSGFRLPDRSGSLDREAQEYLGNPQTERAVRRALHYLADNQNPDGSWGEPNSFDIAMTGLCALSFMSAGHQPDRGPFGDILRQSTDYLVKHASLSGLLIDSKTTHGDTPMYGHGFATLAVAELYGQTRKKDLRDVLDRAVSLILRTQNAEGGWRYYPRVFDADISVVVCQVMALRAAANAGLKIPKDTTDRAIAYVKRCANNPDGGFSYRPTQPGSGLARTGAGTLCLIVMGQRSSPECGRGLEYLLAHPPGTRDMQPFYGYYYCTQACYQAGGKYWSAWYPKLSALLLRSQRSDGSWADSPGVAYATGMGVLALQVPAALLPIYQK
jgi:hypothetical protein